MTNEQIQALKTAAEKAIWGDWDDCKPHRGARGYEVKKGITAVAQHCLKDDAAYIAKANPKVILSLLAEREADKALIVDQAKSIDFLKEQLAQLANFNPDWDKLEAATYSLREHMAELTAANKRIAELESCTVTHLTYSENADADYCRLYAHPAPSIPAPELTVWYGSMPESNGKSNWTAMLRRKGDSITTGVTFVVSEYPDRVRYEADRLRYLIGEISEKPYILDYDADKHSGYVVPDKAPAVQAEQLSGNTEQVSQPAMPEPITRI